MFKIPPRYKKPTANQEKWLRGADTPKGFRAPKVLSSMYIMISNETFYSFRVNGPVTMDDCIIRKSNSTYQDNYAMVTFKDCTFIDTRYTSFNRCNFKNCTFRSPFTHSMFINCTFIDCDFGHFRLEHSDFHECAIVSCKVKTFSFDDMWYSTVSGQCVRFFDSIFPMECPTEGSYVGYKLAHTANGNDALVTLKIPPGARRSSGFGRECRADEAIVLSIQSCDTLKNLKKAYSIRDSHFIYEVGKRVSVPYFDTNRFHDCTAGIHHYMTEGDALGHSF